MRQALMTIGVLAVVSAGYVIHKLEGAADIVGARMPFRGPYLTDGQILVIGRWIERGARND